MTCYFRHLEAVFGKAGIEVTKENKKKIDRVIHAVVGVEYPNCPQTWRDVKRRISEDETTFASELRAAWNKAEIEK